MVSPLEETCENRFRFTAYGNIDPADENDAAAYETIIRLGLNIPKLRIYRRETIEGVLEGVDSLEQSDIRELIEVFRRRDSEGRYAPFCT
ncbi:unnamed protein product, partial [marine sediment metagenome]